MSELSEAFRRFRRVRDLRWERKATSEEMHAARKALVDSLLRDLTTMEPSGDEVIIETTLMWIAASLDSIASTLSNMDGQLD